MNFTKFLYDMRQARGDEKKVVLKQYHNDYKTTLEEILTYAYSPMLTYGITSKGVKFGVGSKSITISDIATFLHMLYSMNERTLKGNQARERVGNFISGFYNGHELLGFLNRSLDIGIGVSTINKVIPNLIFEFKTTLAKKYKWNGKLPFENTYVSQKFDGVRCIVISNEDDTIAYTRNGHEINTVIDLLIEIQDLELGDVVFDGELIKGDGTGEYFSDVVGDVRRKDFTMKDYTYQVFDIMKFEEFKGVNRLSWDLRWHTNMKDGKYLKYTKQTKVKSYAHLEELWTEAITRGWEGLMLRNGDMYYDRKRSKNLLKMKKMQDEEFKIVGVVEGEGKYVNSLGAITILVGDVEVNVGSGFSDEMRKEIWNYPALYDGKFATIQYFEKTSDGSLRFPVFKTIRLEV